MKERKWKRKIKEGIMTEGRIAIKRGAGYLGKGLL